MIDAFSLSCRDSIGSFLIKAEFSLAGVSNDAHYLPQDKVSNLEVSVFDSGVVVLGHEVLVSCKSLFNYCPNFV